MAAAAIPYIIAGISAASAGAAYVNQRNVGAAAQVQATQQAQAEADAARGRELQRRQALATALSSQVAAGVGGAGTFAGQASRDIKDSTNDLAAGNINATRNEQMTLSRGRFARQSADLSATGGLIKSGVDLYKNAA